MRVRVPATTANLGPGFDVLGLALGLWNTLDIALAPQTRITVAGEGADTLPTDEENLVYRAMQALADYVGRPLPPVHLHLHNRIPLQAGLGSSSAAIVGGLLAAQAVLGISLPEEETLALAVRLEGHPDNVAPALLGGLVAVAMVDGHPLAVRVPVPDHLRVVIVLPAVRVSTEAARQLLPAAVPFEDAVFNVSRAVLTVQALSRGDWDLLSRVMEDRLHQPYRKRLIPAYEAVVRAAKDAGARAVVISGSGPALAAFAGEGHDAIGQAMVHAFAAAGVQARAWVLPVAQGAHLVAGEDA